jgi:integrase
VRLLSLGQWLPVLPARRGLLSWPQGEVLLFPSPLVKLRDRSNTTGRLREAFDRAAEQFTEFSSHGFRKSVMTWFDEAGVTARQTADQAGHAKVSMTQDVYFGRGKTGAAAAQILAMPGLESAS